MDALPRVTAACNVRAVCRKQREETTSQPCMVPTAGFQSPSIDSGNLMNISANNCVQQTNHLLLMNHRFHEPHGMRPPTCNNRCEEQCSRWSAGNGRTPGKPSLTGDTSCIQSLEESQQCCMMTEGQLQTEGFLRRLCHPYSGRPGHCDVQKSGGWREHFGCCSSYAGSTSYSASDPKRNLFRHQRSAVLDGSDFVDVQHAAEHVPPEVVQKGDFMWDQSSASSSVLQQSVCDGVYCNVDRLSSVEGISKRFPTPVLPSTADCMFPKQSYSDVSLGLCCQLTKPTTRDWHETLPGIESKELIYPSNQSPTINSSCLASLAAVLTDCTGSVLTDLHSSRITGNCVDKETSRKATIDGLGLGALPGRSLVADKRNVAENGNLMLAESAANETHSSTLLPVASKDGLSGKKLQTDWDVKAGGQGLVGNTEDCDKGTHSLVMQDLEATGETLCILGNHPDKRLTEAFGTAVKRHLVENDYKERRDGELVAMETASDRRDCLVEKNQVLAGHGSVEFEEASPDDGHGSVEQSLVKGRLPDLGGDGSDCPLDPRVCSSATEDKNQSTNDDYSRKEKMADERQKSNVSDTDEEGDERIESDRLHDEHALAVASLSGFDALEIGPQVDGCNNGRDSTEEQSICVNPPSSDPQPPPSSPPLPASSGSTHHETSQEALEANADPSVSDGALCHSATAAAAAVSSSPSSSSLAVTNNGETCNRDEGGLESVDAEERGRGKRKRKAVSYSRYLEMSSSDDEEASNVGQSRRKCLKTSHLMSVQDKNCIGKSNGQRKAAASACHSNDAMASVASGCHSNDAMASVVDSRGRSSVLEKGLTDLKTEQDQARNRDPPTAGGQLSTENEQKFRSSSCPSVSDGGGKEINAAVADSKEDGAMDKQQQQRRTGREKELELEVTNENGEVEIVTIVDLHSSSDEEADLLAMNGEDEIIPLTDNDSYAASSDHEDGPQQATAAQGMMLSLQKDNVSSSGRAASLSETSRVGLDPVHSASCKVENKVTGHDDHAKQEARDRSAVAGPSFETKTSATDRTTANKKSLSMRRKKRKRVRPGDDLSEFGSDAEDNDKVHRLKKMYGIQKQTKPVKTSQMQNSASDKIMSSSRSLGPYIRAIGSKEMPDSYKVVNVKDVDLDAPNSKSKKNLLLPESSCVPSSLKFLDSVPWDCLFCGHGSAYSTLGDLFGPYYPAQHLRSDGSEVKPNSLFAEKGQSPPNKSATDKVLRSPRRLSGRLRATSSDSLNEGSGNLPQELWVHEECAVWTTGVYVARGKLQGLEEAALVAAQVVCSGCFRMGASLGCYVKGCTQNYHYLCAVKAGCFFEEENFSVLCPRHRDKGRKSKGGQSE